MIKRYSAKEKAIITADFTEKQADEAKRGVIPSPEFPDYLKRRGGQDIITFYDLAQINTGTVDSPTWSDHPLIKIPTYASEIVTVSGTFRGVRYRVEPFTSSDFSAFTDRLFDVAPIANWKHYYKKLEVEERIGSETFWTTYPQTLQMLTPSLTRFKFVSGQTYGDLTTEPNKSHRESQLALNGMNFNSRGLEYRGLPAIDYNHLTTGEYDWFPASTDETTSYTVTASYDPNATDVSGFPIRGKIDVYLIPMFGLFMSVASLAPIVTGVADATVGFNVIFGYQVLPRQNFQAYADPHNLLSNDTRTSNFLDYQKARTDVIGSFWRRTSATFAPPTFEEYAIDPTTWRDSTYAYKGAVANTTSQSYFNLGSRTEVGVTGGADMFQRSDPFLVAVIKANGRFYYVWSKADPFSVATTYLDNVETYDTRSSSYISAFGAG